MHLNEMYSNRFLKLYTLTNNSWLQDLVHLPLMISFVVTPTQKDELILQESREHNTVYRVLFISSCAVVRRQGRLELLHLVTV